MAGNENSGRKSRLEKDKDLIDDICKVIRSGNYIKTACLYVDIDETTFYRYMKLGEQDMKEEKDTVYSKFYKSVKKARAVAETRNVAVINKASKENWQASAWWLERSFPDRWGRRSVSVEANVKGDFKHEHEGEVKNVQEYDGETKELLQQLFWKEREQTLGEEDESE